MPCETCKSIEEKVKKARQEGNAEKERVMAMLLESHRKQAHLRHNVVAVEQDFIIWPNGVRWEVVR